ncbi:M48 family metallopeptidase [Pseudemcibacter aquimaris]|uniref:M48 family metallopeptidase n=1 Tax=Pseudemcibacter aquimaris TaxID=2857064 RepID=UPI00201346B7|nr:SprT family zinc-dependent metalloprotease [Pseudemcibacter aquimaris]MCC3861907.1 M48 family metallopeptidase [Pseudemcibacter aquimaris]WDU58659.1 M48 family metallopeptidase [Pseudemcibacter aquimaris]
MNSIHDFNPEIKYHKRARRIKLRYDAENGRAIITLPPFTSKRSALSFAENHIDWLIEQRDKSPDIILMKPGSIIPFLGIDKTIIHEPDFPARVIMTEDEIIVGGRIEGFGVRIENFLKKEARLLIEPIAHELADKTGKSFKRIHIRDTKSRWGSCSSTGTLSFSWRLIMTPPEILEYVVAHEVAHISEMNHSSAFWAIVDQLVDNSKKSRKWLKTEGQNLMLIKAC